MKFLANLIKGNLLLIVCSAMVLSFSSCNKKDYPCPGLGQSDEADLSLFDEEGKLKSEYERNSRVNKKTGLMNKKKPKRLQARRKTHL